MNRMKRTISTILSAIGGVALCHAAVADNIHCNFSQGMPENFILVDHDGNTPSQDVEKFGFTVGSPWIIRYLEDEQNFVAASTSWYEPAGTSNDWMILPTMKVSSETDVISWRAMTSDARFRDGYAVYVSETGDSPDDFDTDAPIFSVDAEEPVWTTHSVSLGKYAGKTIRIAFVNRSHNCAMLFIDDIMAGTKKDLTFDLEMFPYVKPYDDITVRGVAYTMAEAPVNGFSVSCDFGGITYKAEYPDITVNPGDRVPFSVKTAEKATLGKETVFSVEIECNGEIADSKAYGLKGAVNKAVAEETTGSWCGYCVRGIHWLEKMKATYPESFIGVAVHGNDFLETQPYYNHVLLVSKGGGFPGAQVNRDIALKGDPADLQTFHDAVQSRPLYGVIKAEIHKNGDEYSVMSKAMLAETCTSGHYAISYLIIENDVYEADNLDYRQHNSYSSGDIDMGGFENLPEWILDFHFNDVARGTLGDPAGIIRSLPVVIAAGKEYTHEMTFRMPDNVLNPDNVEIIAMLLDTRTNQILNADKASVNDQQGGVEENVYDSFVNPDSTEYFTLEGLSVKKPKKGIYIVREIKSGKIRIRKVLK